MAELPFWQRKSLGEMTREEWESLCDGCGQCCLTKLQDEDTEEIFYTDVACALLDLGVCRCSDYVNRQARVPDCLKLDADNIGTLDWLPPTCAYRLIDAGKPLYEWHPLISGDADSVCRAGMSVATYAISEEEVAVEDLEEHIWPLPDGENDW